MIGNLVSHGLIGTNVFLGCILSANSFCLVRSLFVRSLFFVTGTVASSRLSICRHRRPIFHPSHAVLPVTYLPLVFFLVFFLVLGSLEATKIKASSVLKCTDYFLLRADYFLECADCFLECADCLLKRTDCLLVCADCFSFFPQKNDDFFSTEFTLHKTCTVFDSCT